MTKCDKCICGYCEKRTAECTHGNCNHCKHAHPALWGNPSYFSGICRNKKVKAAQKQKAAAHE